MLWWAAQTLVLASLLAAGVWGLCRFTRIGPAARHALWLVVLAKLLTPPLVAWPWAVPSPLGAIHRVADAGPGIAAPLPSPPFASWIDEGRATLGPIHDSPTAATAADPHSSTPSPPSITRAPAAKPRGLWLPHDLLGLLPAALGGAWLFGGAMFGLIQTARIVRMVRLARRGHVADASLTRRVAQLAQRMGMRAIRVRVVDGIDSPLVWCVWRPTLLWPAGLPATLGHTSIDGLIVHELAHVRRRDHWVGWLELLGGLAWWWNPLFWYVRHQLRENAELACDGWVVGTLPSGRRAYAEALLAVCECMSSRRSAPAPAVGVGTGGRQFLERRLAMILRDRVPLSIPRFGLAMIALFAMGTLPAFSQRTTTEVPASVPGPLTIEPGGTSALPAAPELAIDRPPEPLPPEAQDLIQKFRQDEAEARRAMEERILHDRAELLRRLKELQDRYTRAGQLDEAVAIRDRIRAMQSTQRGIAYGRVFGGSGVGTAPGAAPGGPMGGAVPMPPGTTALPPAAIQDDPGNLTAYRDRAGQTFTFRVVGKTEGTVWGSDVYTDDSQLAAAAVHAGLLRPGQEGTVTVKILPGQAHYEGSDRNGITTQPYDAWQGSFQFQQPPAGAPGALGGGMPGAMPGVPGDRRPDLGPADQHPRRLIVRRDPGTLESLRDQQGKTFRLLVTGATDGQIWGGADNVYTDDSNLATAAVHAGILQPGQQGIVAVTILPDRGQYEASNRNGVASQPWGAWQGSYRIEPAGPQPNPDPPAAGGTAPF